MLKLLHTADWHIGKRFPSFPEEDQKKLSRARIDVVGRILEVARRNAVDAVLCAGDLFDEPNPTSDFWEALAKVFRDHEAAGPLSSGGAPPPLGPRPTGTNESRPAHPPVFLVPGNHDPLTVDSVWAATHPFRSRLPRWVHVVDRDDFTFELGAGAVLHARPCRSKAGENDPAMQLPARTPGADHLRIGCVHGTTFDIPGFQTNFPIARDAGVQRGLDYLAIGDTHSFRDVTADSPVPTVYPGAPEPTAFDESGAGQVAIVAFFRHGRRPRVHAERVAFWTWLDVTCRDLNELRGLLTTRELDRRVVRLTLDMTVTVAEEAEVERIVSDLQGTEATHGRAGILLLDRSGLRLTVGSIEAFGSLPPVLDDVVARLRHLAEDELQGETATRALTHLYKLLQRQGSDVAR